MAAIEPRKITTIAFFVVLAAAAFYLFTSAETVGLIVSEQLTKYETYAENIPEMVEEG